MGDITPNMSIFVPSSGEELYRASYAAGQSNIDLHQHTGAPDGGLQLISDSIANGAITPAKLSPQVRESYKYIANYGISYSNGTFAVTSSDGSAFSSTNRGYITFQNKLNPGQLLTVTQIVNQSFLDAASGSSEIAGNLFGRASGVDSTQDITFYLYAVINDAQDTIQIMICPLSCQEVAPTSTNIGMPSSPIADSENSFWSIDNITAGDYDGNPAVEIGCFRMRKTGGVLNDWTVQGLTTADGIGACSCNGGGDTPISPIPLTIGTQNISFISISGFFQVADSEGNPLSLTNAASITLNSNVTASTIVQAPIYSNRGFRDSTNVGGSDIAGNLFGTTTNIDWAQDMPWFLYAVLSISGDSVGFAICRDPSINFSPVTANSGTIGKADADLQGSFYYLARDASGNNVIPTATPGGTATDFINLYQQQPCLRLGSFRMRKNGTTVNDWTVQALSVVGGDGMQKTHAETVFTLPAGVNGADTGKFFVKTVGGDTVPLFSTQTVTYRLDSSGEVTTQIYMETATVAGVGSNNLQYVLPYISSGIAVFGQGQGTFIDSSATQNQLLIGTALLNNTLGVATINAVNSNLLNSSIDTNDSFQIVIRTKIS